MAAPSVNVRVAPVMAQDVQNAPFHAPGPAVVGYGHMGVAAVKGKARRVEAEELFRVVLHERPVTQSGGAQNARGMAVDEEDDAVFHERCHVFFAQNHAAARGDDDALLCRRFSGAGRFQITEEAFPLLFIRSDQALEGEKMFSLGENSGIRG